VQSGTSDCFVTFEERDPTLVCQVVSFLVVAAVMAKMGYITIDFVAIDGTKIKANAGMKFTAMLKSFGGSETGLSVR
jgi:hypothetical protein